MNLCKCGLRISNLKLGIGIPLSFPTVPAGFFYSFALMEKPSYDLIHADNGHIDDLRNNIVEKALALGCTKLIMLDTDMVYHPKTITKLLSDNLPVVGALCFRRYPPFDSIILKIKEIDVRTNGYESIDEWEEGEILECDATGAGCLMFDTSIFRKLPYPWFKFQKQAGTGSIIREDIGICQDLK